MISVVVPVYNVQEYLTKCVESIKNQTYNDLDIILVDDGSTDGSGDLCDELALTDSRIKVLHKRNGGLSDARNAGIEASSGEYIGFVDSDDYIAPKMYDALLSGMVSANAEIGVCGINFISDGVIKKISYSDSLRVLNSKEALKAYFLSDFLNASACNKLYLRSLFDSIRFPFGKKHEDIAVMHLLIEKANAVVHIGTSCYFYIHRKGSITKSLFSEKDMDLVRVHIEIYKHYEQCGEFRKLAEMALINAYMAIINKMILYNCDVSFQQIYCSCLTEIRNKQKNVFQNKYIDIRGKTKVFMVLHMNSIYRRIIHYLNTA